jgi:hypothetical protein
MLAGRPHVDPKITSAAPAVACELTRLELSGDPRIYPECQAVEGGHMFQKVEPISDSERRSRVFRTDIGIRERADRAPVNPSASYPTTSHYYPEHSSS